MNIYSHNFENRHIGPSEADLAEMLHTIGVNSLDELIEKAVPEQIRLDHQLPEQAPLSESEYMSMMRELASKNQVFRSFIGMGYYGCFTPSVILRNIFENPGWYTQYTPYQSEISQGRLEALLNFQTLVSDLSGLPVANASLLDEATAAAEAMSMLYSHKNKRRKEDLANVLLVSESCFPQTIEVLRTRAKGLGIEVIVGSVDSFDINEKVFAALVQYPDQEGNINDYEDLANKLHQQGSHLIVAADLMSLCLLKAPGEFGADVVIGSSQRMGIPMGYGGPHAAYFATQEQFLRMIPGRIIGVSVDKHGNQALRMALQTREQHIRRDKATSNICTAQALLAIMSSMYAVYHGPVGLKAIASRIHLRTQQLVKQLEKVGVQAQNHYFFDTVRISLESVEQAKELKKHAEGSKINFYYQNNVVGISLDETSTIEDINNIAKVFADSLNQNAPAELTVNDDQGDHSYAIPEGLQRQSSFLEHPVFNSHHSETAMMRYIKSLENKDLSLNTAMIPLGSCTMKLNAATELIPVSWPEFANIHPFAPAEQAKGYHEIISELGKDLCTLTGFSGISFQPNSGAQGEYTGLVVIKAYLENKGETQRDIALIPSSAHGTNPASAVMAGFKVVVVACDDEGNIDLEDLSKKVQQYHERLGCLMITYPSTHGVFEESVIDICNLIHEHGGQVYMDGANLNAQVGLTSPGYVGADVCHLNLHKTFAIPHGGGGPGMGPICVASHLVPFLPNHHFHPDEHRQGIGAVSATHYGSASILLISYAYIKLLGSHGLTEATRYAILNANYMKSRLENDFKVLFQGNQGFVAHEFIIDLRSFKRELGLEVDDITKRLIDYGFHAPTVSWPVAGTIMIEPTESEPKEELDRFCDAMLSIRGEINAIANGTADAEDNALVNAPHTLKHITSDQWSHAYTREVAAFPMPNLYQSKFWPSVGRVNNTHGDRNVICTCPPIEDYAVEAVS